MANILSPALLISSDAIKWAACANNFSDEKPTGGHKFKSNADHTHVSEYSNVSEIRSKSTRFLIAV